MPKPSEPPAASLRKNKIQGQRTDFKRLGVLGDWDHPYRTMEAKYEAQRVERLRRTVLLRNGHVYRGAKPVHWCLNCRSALAEAEVEYEENSSPAIDVGFELVSEDRDKLAAGPSASTCCPRGPCMPSFGPRRPGRCPRTKP